MNFCKYWVFSFLLVCVPGWSYAYSECKRPVSKIWNNLTSAKTVHVGFSDDGSAIKVKESEITEGQMARFVSFVLTAQASGRQLIVRYSEDNLPCPPPAGSARSDIEGIWITAD